MTAVEPVVAPGWPAEFERILRAHCRFVAPGEPIDADAPLALLGVDSLQMLSMIVQIEETFDVLVPDTMLTGDEFGSAGAAWRAVLVLRGAGGDA